MSDRPHPSGVAPLPKVVVRETVAPAPRGDWLFGEGDRRTKSEPSPLFGAMLDAADGLGIQEAITRTLEQLRAPPPPRIDFIHPREYRRRAIAAIWQAWGGPR